MILTFKLDSKDIAGIKKLISLCENLLSFETKSEITLEPQLVNIEPVTVVKMNLINLQLLKVMM